MEYEKPEMVVLQFGEHIGTLDVVGASQNPPNTKVDGEWNFE